MVNGVTEDAYINPYKKTIVHTGEKAVSSVKMVLVELDSCMQKNETLPPPLTSTKINPKWIKDLNNRPEPDIEESTEYG